MTKSADSQQKVLLSFFTIFISLLSLSQALAADRKVVLLPLALYAEPGKDYLRQGIGSMLSSRLSGEDLQVIADKALAPFLREGEEKSGITSLERAEELADRLEAGYAVFGSVTGTGTGYSLDLSILDRTGDPPRVTNLSEAVTEDQLIPKMADVAYDLRAIIAGVDIRKFQKPGAESEETGKGLFFQRTAESFGLKPSGRISLKMGVMSMDVADLNGNGREEVLVMGRSTLSVYERKEESLALRSTLEAARGEEFLKVSAGDMDGDGRPEIYLVSFYSARAQSAVWEWDGEFKKRRDRHGGHLHVVRNLGGGKSMLLYQDSAIGNFFRGRIFVMEWSAQSKLDKREPLPDLKGAQLYTLALYDFDRNGTPDFLGLGMPSLGEESFIQVWDLAGNVLAKGTEPVGGTNNAIRYGETTPGNLPPRISFNSKITAMDVDNNGRMEILALANEPLTRSLDFWLYQDGSVVAFKPEGGSLVRSYKSGKIRFCLTDMQVYGDRLYISAQEESVLNVMTEGAGRIMWFE